MYLCQWPVIGLSTIVFPSVICLLYFDLSFSVVYIKYNVLMINIEIKNLNLKNICLYVNKGRAHWDRK